jgi:pyrroloquinoline quinone (PQQ) biosynthesis protein C
VTFFERLQTHTADAREALMSSTVIVDCLDRRVSHETYSAFLNEAYHHVRHTVPLLMACGSRLPPRLDWLQKYVIEYIEEEHGHEQWIRDDILAMGVDADELISAGPSLATELMVSFAYDTVQRRNPVGFFGMVYVLEGTSVALASRAAEIIRAELNLPKQALRYLSSHGDIDQEHIASYAEIVNRIDDGDDRAAILHAARVFFKLYADVFASLPRAEPCSKPANGRRVA